MPASEVTFSLLDGPQAAALTDDLAVLRAEVYTGALATSGIDRDSADRGGFPARFRKQCRQPGFVLAVARSGDFLVGAMAGMPLRPATSWWSDLTTTLPDDVTAEHPGRTFALVEFLVRASWRRQGIGRYLVELTLRNRAEERATVVVPPSAHAAQAAFQSWGWRRVGRTQSAALGTPASDVLVTALAAGGR